MSIPKGDQLAAIATEILEAIVFSFAEQVPAPESFVGNEYLTAKVRFSGPSTGTMTIVAANSLCREWASTMTDEYTEQMVRDSLAEVTNVISGHCVSQLEGDQHPHLLPPIVESTSIEEWQSLVKDPNTVFLSVDFATIMLNLAPKD